MMRKKIKNALSAENMISIVSSCFRDVSDIYTKRKSTIDLHDYLMSCIAMFKLKYPSLLQFDNDRIDPAHSHNLKTLFHVNQAPSDSALRQRLDELDPKSLRKVYTKLFSVAQRNKVLESFQFINGAYLCSIDGTGYFHSNSVHCDNCCVKNHRDGRVSYYHQMLCAVLIHPDKGNVIPFCPEPIVKSDGQKKNDCERNASKRLLQDLKREHPHLKLVIVEDSLASNAPHIKLIEELEYQYILGAKPGDHKWLFSCVAASSRNHYECTDAKNNHHRFEFINDVPLNESNEEVRVNFLEHWETRPNGKIIHHTWVSNIKLTENNVFQIMRGGRARWKVENETINTLKTQGYQFEHNFGHGKKNLSVIMALLMMIAFMIDELGFIACKYMQQAKQVLLGKKRMWRKIRSTFDSFFIDSWDDLFDGLINGIRKSKLTPDTS